MALLEPTFLREGVGSTVEAGTVEGSNLPKASGPNIIKIEVSALSASYMLKSPGGSKALESKRLLVFLVYKHIHNFAKVLSVSKCPTFQSLRSLNASRLPRYMERFTVVTEMFFTTSIKVFSSLKSSLKKFLQQASRCFYSLQSSCPDSLSV